MSAVLSGCTTVPASFDMISKEAVISKTTKTQVALQQLPAPQSKVTVAVYEFEDKTGQFRPTEAGQTLSRAVSQGGDEILIKALQDAGLRSWFTIIERSNLNNLLKERQIITEMRSRYLGEKTVNSQALPPLLFAGVIFEGGIVGFDTNTVTGGAAARYLGIGGRTDYRQNVVTVHLRAVSVKTGEVLASVTTEKTIASIGVSANAFRFVTFDNLLEADAGITSNEPGLLALRQAVEKSVYALIMEGAEIGLWNFRDQAQGMALLEEYRGERGSYKISQSQTALASSTSQMANATQVKPKKQEVASVQNPQANPKKPQIKPRQQAVAQPPKKQVPQTTPRQSVMAQPVAKPQNTAPKRPAKVQPSARVIAAPTQPVAQSALTVMASPDPKAPRPVVQQAIAAKSALVQPKMTGPRLSYTPSASVAAKSQRSAADKALEIILYEIADADASGTKNYGAMP